MRLLLSRNQENVTKNINYVGKIFLEKMEKNTFHIPFDLYSNRVKIIYFRLYFQNALLSSQDKIHPLSDTSKIIDHGNDQNRNNNSRRGIASPLETAPA